MIRPKQIAISVKLPFNLILISESSKPEQFVRPPFWKLSVKGLGA